MTKVKSMQTILLKGKVKLRNSIFGGMVCVGILPLSGCTHVKINSQASPAVLSHSQMTPPAPSIKVTLKPAYAPWVAWKPMTTATFSNTVVQTWTKAQARQIVSQKSGSTILLRWHGERLTVKKAEQNSPNLQSLSLDAGYSLVLPDQSFGELPPRPDSDLTLLHRNVPVERLSVEQAFNHWVKEQLVSHAKANDFEYLLDHDNLTGTFPSAQSAGSSAIAVLDCCKPMGCYHVTDAYFLVRLVFQPHLVMLPLCPVGREAMADTGQPVPPRLFLLNHHLLLQTDGKMEAIQPDGTPFEIIARFR